MAWKPNNNGKQTPSPRRAATEADDQGRLWARTVRRINEAKAFRDLHRAAVGIEHIVRILDQNGATP